MPLKIKNQTKKKGEIPIPAIIPESEVEAASLEILSELGYDYLYGPDIAPETEDAEREDFGIFILPRRLRAAVDRLNPKIPAGAREEAIKKVLRAESQDLVHNNRAFHSMLANGVDGSRPLQW
ncbi:Type I restriction-modification system, restriction subunit R [Methanosarcina siciliae C2J]|uniref:type I site-specific deoxyribonuclease n=1 Tax=Methanosarcina siciliae C2J TaxID=1434118 RepID=A0A0E3PLR8_9EURY|nr:type I restriction endonuclease [Methanosarcina siciliae]AKB36314.1 Type I restriction-modification system, restriction subunit R [Methanosarcina siciliae C2J]